SDTLRAVQAVPGLVSSLRYRHSQSTKMRLRRTLLAKEEKRLAQDLIHGDLDSALASLEALPAARAALSLDAASDYLLFLTGPRQDPGEDFKRREAAILGRRNRLSEPVASLPHPPWAVPPHEGHATARVGLGTGFRDGYLFQEVGLRPALHDLLDPPHGYSADGQLEMFHARIRHERTAGRTYLQELTLLDITSISPWDAWVRPLSWKVRTGVETPDGLDAEPWDSPVYGSSAGAGRAFGTSLWRDELWYALAAADAGFGSVFRDGYRLGAGLDGGLRIGIAPRWSGLIEAKLRRYPGGDPGSHWKLRFGQDVRLSDGFSLRIELGIHEQKQDAAVTLHRFL
ncbi:MAG: hypothetical protein AAB576_00375, partial [Elusimicrobiota bacterium]